MSRHAKLIAIAVGQGDAFYLEAGLRVLVDGGRSVDSFATNFIRATKQQSVNVVIATHNDSDHANGVLGFLNSGLQADEVWLPGAWMERLTDLLANPSAFLEELAVEIDKLDFGDVDGERQFNLEDLAPKDSEQTESVPTQANGVSATSLLGAIEGAPEVESLSDLWWCPPVSWRVKVDPRSSYLELHARTTEATSLMMAAIDAADRIRRIALSAHHSGARIRWFQFTAGSKQEVHGGFWSLNSEEVLGIRGKPRSALSVLALSVSNKRSLVFLAQPWREGPGIVFSADSDLVSCAPLPKSSSMLITAPHHGSDSNAAAYDWVAGQITNPSSVSWIRSDGRFSTRPGNKYLSQQGMRFCTLCRGAHDCKQDVRLGTKGERWIPLRTRRCTCV